MNQFKQNLIANSNVIKANRAELIANNTERAQASLIRKLEDEKSDIDAKILAHTDLYPDSELSLQIGKADYNAEAWVNTLQNYEVALLNKEVELSVARKNYDKYFGTITEEAN